MAWFEKGPGLGVGLRDFGKDCNTSNVSTGLIGGFVLSLVTVPVIVKNATAAGLDAAAVSDWLFSCYLFGGILGIILSLMYKQPIGGAWSIPGVAAVASALGAYNINQAVGAFLVAGVIVLVLGLTGWVSKVVKILPLPIMMAMVAGVLWKFSAAMVTSFTDGPVIAIIGIIGYFVCKKLLKKVPPVLGTFVFGFIGAWIMGTLDFQSFQFGVASPTLYTPEFSFGAIISMAIPLAILVIGAENMQATGVLMSEGYKPPVNAMTILSGIGGLITPWFGGHNANIAGPLTAFNASEDAGPPEKRYVATVCADAVFALFGVFSITAVSLITFLPAALSNLLVGLVFLGIIAGALNTAFSAKKFRLGSLVALIVAIANVTIFHIGNAFWSLVFGILFSLMVETKDFGFGEKKEVPAEAAAESGE